MGLMPETRVRILKTLAEEPAHGCLIAECLDRSHSYLYHFKACVTSAGKDLTMTTTAIQSSKSM
jgi:hypothetical protein